MLLESNAPYLPACPPDSPTFAALEKAKHSNRHHPSAPMGAALGPAALLQSPRWPGSAGEGAPNTPAWSAARPRQSSPPT